MTVKRTTILGVYVLAAGLLQLYFYFVMAMSTDEEAWLVYSDPRIGIFVLESIIRGKEQVAPSEFRWFSAAFISFIGAVLVMGRPIVKTYIVSELILMIPNVIFFLFVIWANLSPAHGFSVSELLFPTLVMIVFSMIPLRLSFWCRTRNDPQIESLNLSRA